MILHTLQDITTTTIVNLRNIIITRETFTHPDVKSIECMRPTTGHMQLAYAGPTTSCNHLPHQVNTLERRAYFFKCLTTSKAALVSHSNRCPPSCGYSMISYSTRPWRTNRNAHSQPPGHTFYNLFSMSLPSWEWGKRISILVQGASSKVLLPYGTDCNANMIYLHRWSWNNLAITFCVQATCHNTGTCSWICSCGLKTQAMYDISWLLGSCYDTLWTLYIVWLIAICTQALKTRFEATWATSSWL